MRTIRTKVYKFSELSDEAKDTAIENYRNAETFDYLYDEAWESVQAFAKVFNINIDNIDFQEPYRSQYSFRSIDETALDLTGQRLATYIWNHYRSDLFKGKYYGKLVDTFKDGTKIPVSKEHPIGKRHVLRYSKCTLERGCVLTGVCYDDSILEPLYKFLDKPTSSDFRDLLEDCISSICFAIQEEIKGRSKDEAMAEELTNLEYEFTKDGEIFHQ